MPRKFLGGKPTVGTTNTPVVVESRTLTATDPVTIAGGTSADLSSDRTIAVKDANTSGQKGVVSLTDSTSTTSSTVAATATAVKAAKDAADAKVPTTRTISTTAPLTGGGDLSTDRTLAVSTFTGDSGSGGARGVVPAPAAGDAAAGKYLKADGTWATVSATGGGVTDATYVTLSTNGTLTDERVLTAGNYVTITDGGAGSTVTVAVDAATANTVSKVVARDGSGNFSAGTITAALTGNASTSTALSSARTFALTGDVTGSVSSDLTSGASIAASIGSGKVTSTHILDGTIVNDDINATAGIVDTKLATISTAGKVSNSATTATASNGASTIVLRDASQNFSTAGTITAGGFSGPLTGAVTGNASTATTLQTSRNINGIAFNGSADITVTAAAGTLTGASLNSTVTSATGLVTIGTSPTITTPALTLSTSTSNTEGRIAWDATNDYLSVGTGTAQATFVPASLPSIVATFSKSGTLATGTGTFRWYNDSGKTLTIGTVRASVGTAPTGASLIVDVNVSASGAAPATIYSTQANRPTIAASAFTATGSTKSTTTIANTDYLTVDIDQVGSTVAGSDLTVVIWLSYV